MEEEPLFKTSTGKEAMNENLLGGAEQVSRLVSEQKTS
jgi:hypothetical protein